MGSEERARAYASPFYGIWKDLVFQLFNKCGNCPYRFKCLNDLLRINRDSVMRDIKECNGEAFPTSDNYSLSHKVFMLSRNCARCDKAPVCTKIISDKGYLPELTYEQVRRCLDCGRLENCIAYSLDKSGLSTAVLLSRVTKMLMRCKWDGLSRAMNLSKHREE